MTSFRFRTLAELCDLRIASVNPRSNPNDEFWYVDISAVDNNTKRITSPQRIRGEQASVRARQLICTDDILVATTRPNLNAVAKVPHEYDGEVCSTGFCVLRPNDELDPDYLFSFVQSAAFITPLDDLTKGALYPAVTDRQVLNQAIRWIPVEEQRVIANSLNSQLAEVEKARQATETAFSDVESLKAAVFRTTFKQIVPVAPPKNLPIAPNGWQWKKLTDIAELESGHTPSRFRPDWWGGDISWVSLTEIRSLDGMWVEETQLRTNKNGIANSSARILPKGTVCFSRTAPVGFVAIMAKPMATSQDFANWVCGENLDPGFLMYALLRSRNDLRAIAEGATHKTIYMPALHSFHICVPDPSEQRRLVASLREELKSIEVVHIALEKQLSELKQLPNRILAQTFES